MRLIIFTFGVIFTGVLMNIVLNNYIQFGGLKINWILIFMLVLIFRHSKLVIAFFGIFVGLIMDALSHGIMGLYATSFFLTLILTSQAKKFFYANTFLAASLAVFSMSIFEGWISLTILGLFEPGLELSSYILISTFPISILQGLMTPIIVQLIIWGENLLLKETT